MEHRQRHFQQLESLYQRLDRALPSAPDNPCGRCRQCCTASGMSHHNVTALELELVGERVGEEKLASFRRFLQQTGEFEVCPNFDETIWGCGIYDVRPYSCRVFGHHRRETSRLPQLCVFSGVESVFGVGEYLSKVPYATELKELARSFWPYCREPFEQASAARSPTPGMALQACEGDALDRALSLLSQGDLQAALVEFETSDLPSTPYVLYCLSLVFEGLARHGDACTALEVAIQQAPECVPLWFRLGCNLYSLGNVEQGVEAFHRTLELDESHPESHALLGSHYLQNGQRDSALLHLARSLALRPDPTVEGWLRAAV